MMRFGFALALAMVVAAPAVFAQGQQQRPAQPAARPPAAAPAAPVAPVPQPVPETFDKWQVICRQDGAGKQACQMQQVLRDNNTSQLAFAIRPPAAAGQRPVATVIPPWGALLARGIDLQIDANPAVRVPIRVCLPSGCVADFTLVEAMEQQMQKGTNLKITMAAANGQATSLEVPLAGFGKAYARMVEKSK